MTKRLLLCILIFYSATFMMAQNDTDTVMYNVDLNPTWQGCDEKSDSLRRLCLEDKLAGFFNDFILYPDKARKKRIEGIVIVQFIVEKDGSISNLRLMHDIGYGCGDEVIRALQHLPRLIPGEHQGQKVRVSYKASFNFKIR